MTRIPMFDTVAPRDLVGRIPSGQHADAVAGYVEGTTFIDAALLFALFPNAYHLPIGGTGGAGYRCADVEVNFGRLDRFGNWLVNLADLTHGPPVGYTFASQMGALKGVAHALGIPDADRNTPAPLWTPGEDRLAYLRAHGVLWWGAHFNFIPHICGIGCQFPLTHATQFTDHALPAPLDADQSVIENAEVFFPAGHVAPPDPHHFLVFASGLPAHPGGLRGGPWHSPFGLLDERQTVLSFYGAHQQPKKYEKYLHELRHRMLWLAQRLDRVAILLDPLPNGDPSWDVDNRGWRHRRLARMATTGDLD